MADQLSPVEKAGRAVRNAESVVKIILAGPVSTKYKDLAFSCMDIAREAVTELPTSTPIADFEAFVKRLAKLEVMMDAANIGYLASKLSLNPSVSTAGHAVQHTSTSSTLSTTSTFQQSIENVSHSLKEIQLQEPQKSSATRSTSESVKHLKPLDHIYLLGESKSGLEVNFEGPQQNYEELKRQHLNARTLFEDPSFPANEASFCFPEEAKLNYSKRKIVWLRPREITGNPVFFSDGAERFDVCQGELGDCWLLAAIANLTLHQGHLERVVPHDQTFDKGDYAGIFHFRFWQYGKWVDVVVDDRLPTVNRRLVLMSSTANHEFWSALLEKAYAKLHGSYLSLEGGRTSEAMEDFTGGLTEVFKLQYNECLSNLFTIMLKAHQRGSFLSCSTFPEMNYLNGLIENHAYSITAVKTVQTIVPKTQVKDKILEKLIRIRNPWGNEAEWTGAWTDKSKEWTFLSASDQQALDHTPNADGEFWMSFADFKKNFFCTEITNLTPDALGEDIKRQWKVNYFEGQWIPGVSAGDFRYTNSIYTNPQYMITLVDHDEDDDKNMCTCVVSLMKKDHRIKRKMGFEKVAIGFFIYEVKDKSLGKGLLQSTSGTQVLNSDFFRNNTPVEFSQWVYGREVNKRFRLKPGRYCIVPSTHKPNQNGDFMIRFFTEKTPKDVFENDDGSSLVTHNDDDKKKETKTSLQPKTSPTERSNVEKEAFEYFWNVAGTEVGASDLQKILNQVFEKELIFEKFSTEACRSMIAMMDFDGSEKLGFDEFIQLWRNLKNWVKVFQKHDRDGNKSISAGELKEAFHEVGINVNRQVLRMLVNRFGHYSKDTATIESQFYFNEFICCSLKMKRCIEVWNSKKTKQGGIPNTFLASNELDQTSLTNKSSFTLDEFMRNVL